MTEAEVRAAAGAALPDDVVAIVQRYETVCEGAAELFFQGVFAQAFTPRTLAELRGIIEQWGG